MKTETFEHIRDDIQTRLVEQRYDDPALAPDLLAYVLRELGKLAALGTNQPISTDGIQLADGFRFVPTPGAIWWATDLLVAMQSRAVSGGWPYEREQPYEMVLDADERGGW